MEKAIKERYNDAILETAMRRYGIAPQQIHPLDGFESFIYTFERDRGAYILRIGHSRRRSVSLIRGEVDWINYLAAGGASVARAILSERGELVEVIDDGQGGHFLATAFVEAPGRPLWKVGWTPDLFETYGRLLGRMHALSQDYVPSDPACQRPQWNDDIMLDVEGNVPDEQTEVLARFEALMTYLEALPRDRASYGLIHFDAHGGNMFVDETGRITLFDFDDCNYSWYINDIAIVLFYIVMGQEDKAAFIRAFMSHFLRGYRRENTMDPAWLREIPYFLKLREIDLYAVIHRSFDLDDLDPWCARFMRDRRARIEAGVPYVDFDFTSLAEYL